MRRALKRIGQGIALLILLLLLFATYAILVPPSPAPLPDQAGDYLVTNVRIVDVEAGTAGRPTSVRINEGRIAAIGSQAVPASARRIDVRGAYLMPGLWDMHVHSFQASPQMHFPLFVANGVTSVRDMMDCPEPEDALIACFNDKQRWSSEVDAGRMAAPRIVEVASFYFDRPEMTAKEARRRSAEFAARGIPALKVYNNLSPQAYAAIAQIARERQVRLVGHLPKQVALVDAIAAGQKSFEHAHLFVRDCTADASSWRTGKLDSNDPVDTVERLVDGHDATACRSRFAAMRETGAWFVPTHVTREEDAQAGNPAFVNDPRLAYLDPLSRWAYRDDLTGTTNRYPGMRGRKALAAYFDLGLALTGEAHRAGVDVLVGTDTAVGGFRYHDELTHLSKAGLSNADILRAATIDAARYARLDRETGSIAVGKRADLILLSANPLDDIRSSRRIESVWLAGRLYDREALDRLLEFTREQAANPANWVRLLWGFATSGVSGEL